MAFTVECSYLPVTHVHSCLSNVICLSLTCTTDGVLGPHWLGQLVALSINTPTYKFVTTALPDLELTSGWGALWYVTLSLTLIHDKQFCQHTLLQAGSHIQRLATVFYISTTVAALLHGWTLQVMLAAQATFLVCSVHGAGAWLLQLEWCGAADTIVITCKGIELLSLHLLASSCVLLVLPISLILSS
jgi:hypothetical protein